jgi:hypothetical protein
VTDEAKAGSLEGLAHAELNVNRLAVAFLDQLY